MLRDTSEYEKERLSYNISEPTGLAKKYEGLVDQRPRVAVIEEDDA
jgi:hypothetical protein